MKYYLCILIGLISVPLSAQMTLELKPLYKTTVIECEPIPVEVAWENASDQEINVGQPATPLQSGGGWFIINGKKINSGDSGAVPLWSSSVPWTIKPGERKTDRTDLHRLIDKAGTYQVSLIIERTQPHDSISLHLESNTMEITIQLAQGEDLEALNYAINNSKPNQRNERKINACAILCNINDSDPVAKAIVEKYPTSVYAAYIQGFAGYQYEEQWLNYDFIKYLVYRDGPPQGEARGPGAEEALRKMHQNSVETDKKWCLIRGPQLIDYLKGRSDVRSADIMRLEAGYRFAYAFQYERARIVLERLIQDGKDERAVSKAKQLIAFLKEKKFIPAK